MKTLKKLLLLLIIVPLIGIVGICSPSQVAKAATITVTSTSGGTGGPNCTLRDAITAANTDTATGGCPAGSGADTIILASGVTYTLTMVDNNPFPVGATGLPWITSQITIEGNEAIIERDNADGTTEFRIFFVTIDGNLTLNELTVSNGHASNGTSGGGLINDRGVVAINNSTFSGNHAEFGGGISSGGTFGTLTINKSTISGNSSSRTFYSGGGIYIGDSTMNINDSIINGNSATGPGGGICIDGGIVTLISTIVSGNSTGGSGGGIFGEGGLTAIINNSSISGNSAGNRGGGAYLSGNGTVTMTNSTISNNSATYVGGIFRSSGELIITNSTISGNISYEGKGGGINNFGDAAVGTVLKLYNSTVTGNSAPIGGGIYSEDYGSTVELTNSIVASQLSGEDCGGEPVTSFGYNLDSDGTCNLTAAGDISDTEPHLDLLGDNGGPTETHALLDDSPAIDAGNPAGCEDNIGPLITDQRGFPRFSRCDIGAYEKQPIAFSTKTVNQSLALQGDPLTYTVALTNGGEIELSNVQMTDTLPSYLTYIDDSLSATSGSYGFDNGTISWEGSVNASEVVTITFGAEVNQQVNVGSNIVNSAVINGGREVITRTASVEYGAYIYLPVCTRNYCPDFFDDFSDPSSGWEVVDDEYVLAEYINDEYRVAPKVIDYIYSFPAPTCSRENYEVEVDARWVSTTGGSYGILFGALADYSRYYIYHVDTYWQEFSVARRDPSGWTQVVPWTYSSAINADTASNHLKLTRNGTQYTLEVNGINLGTWSDGSLTGSTYVGVMTFPYFDETTYDTRFDNFSVKRLPGSDMSVQSGQAVPDFISGADTPIKKHHVIPAPEASLLFRDEE